MAAPAVTPELVDAYIHLLENINRLTGRFYDLALAPNMSNSDLIHAASGVNGALSNLSMDSFRADPYIPILTLFCKETRTQMLCTAMNVSVNITHDLDFYPGVDRTTSFAETVHVLSAQPARSDWSEQDRKKAEWVLPMVKLHYVDTLARNQLSAPSLPPTAAECRPPPMFEKPVSRMVAALPDALLGPAYKRVPEMLSLFQLICSRTFAAYKRWAAASPNVYRVNYQHFRALYEDWMSSLVGIDEEPLGAAYE